MYKGKYIKPFENKIWLASPTMHGEELQYMTEAYETNWMSTVGANINEVERITCEKVGCGYSVALSSGTAALHMAVKLAGIEAYGQPDVGHGAAESLGTTYKGVQTGSFGSYNCISFNGNNLSSRKVVYCLPIERPTQVKKYPKLAQNQTNISGLI